MAQYRDLNAPPQQTFAEIVAAMQDQAKSSKTGASGVKDLGESGDIVWPRWDGGEDSVREVSANVEAARESIQELNEVVLPGLADELEDSRIDLQQKLDAANARIDDIIVDGGGAGNFTTYSINPPTGDGTGEGDQWFRVVNSEVIGQWRWDGSTWQPVTLTDAIIAGIDLSKLVSNGSLSEVVANKMFADLFTANKITAQEIESGSITSQHIASGGIIADVIQGGHFTGETFEGGTFVGGEIRTSDDLPGQVSLRDDGYVDGDGTLRPGIRINPTSTYNPARPPGIGSNANGLIVTGGTDTSGNRSYVFAGPDEVGMRSRRSDGTEGVMFADPNNAYIQTTRPGGNRFQVGSLGNEVSLRRYDEEGVERAAVFASPSQVGLTTSEKNGPTRYLIANSTGVWVQTNKSGAWESWNLEETANDTGWINFTLRSGISGTGSPALRLKGGMVYFRGTLTRSGTWPQGWTEIAGPFNPRYRPETTMQFPGAITDDRRTLLRMGADGILSIYMSASIAGTATVPLNPLSYVLG